MAGGSVSLFFCAKTTLNDEHRAFDLGKYLLDLVVLSKERRYGVCIGFGRPGRSVGYYLIQGGTCYKISKGWKTKVT